MVTEKTVYICSYCKAEWEHKSIANGCENKCKKRFQEVKKSGKCPMCKGKLNEKYDRISCTKCGYWVYL